MKQTFRIMMLMAALTLAWGCSSDDDDQPQEPEVVEPTPEPTPEPTAVFTATEGQPEWLIDGHGTTRHPIGKTLTLPTLKSVCTPS